MNAGKSKASQVKASFLEQKSIDVARYKIFRKIVALKAHARQACFSHYQQKQVDIQEVTVSMKVCIFNYSK